MLVIRPNHKSAKISLAEGLTRWAELSLEENVVIPDDYKDVYVVVNQVSREIYIESMSKARASTEDTAGEGQLYAAMCDLVRAGVDSISGLHDESGPIDIKAGEKGLADADMELLGINELLVDLWRLVKCYNEVNANEKKHFGGQAQLTSVA